MLAYTLKRLIQGIVTVWFIATATFIAMHAVPGDPLANERASEGQASPEQRRYRVNFVSNYTFDRAVLGGTNLLNLARDVQAA